MRLIMLEASYQLTFSLEVKDSQQAIMEGIAAVYEMGVSAE